jgi:dTDP-4-dehydrorhamnose reductase
MKPKEQKVLVLGSSGMLGHQIVLRLRKNSSFIVYDFSRKTNNNKKSTVVDVRDDQNLIYQINEIKPDIIINCVGVLVGASSKDVGNAAYINSYLPHRLKRYCDLSDSKLIHISTDCVFSGTKGGYLEDAVKDGTGVYAQTKSIGEVDGPAHLMLRTSIVGPELKGDGTGLFDWFMKQKGEVRGFTKSIWSGVTTVELSKIIEQAIVQNLCGLYHVTNGESISKYELLMLFNKYSNKKINVVKVDKKLIDKSILDTRQELRYQIPDYNQMVDEMIQFIRLNHELYQHYQLK